MTLTSIHQQILAHTDVADDDWNRRIRAKRNFTRAAKTRLEIRLSEFRRSEMTAVLAERLEIEENRIRLAEENRQRSLATQQEMLRRKAERIRQCEELQKAEHRLTMAFLKDKHPAIFAEVVRYLEGKKIA